MFCWTEPNCRNTFDFCDILFLLFHVWSPCEHELLWWCLCMNGNVWIYCWTSLNVSAAVGGESYLWNVWTVSPSHVVSSAVPAAAVELTSADQQTSSSCNYLCGLTFGSCWSGRRGDFCSPPEGPGSVRERERGMMGLKRKAGDGIMGAWQVRISSALNK